MPGHIIDSRQAVGYQIAIGLAQAQEIDATLLFLQWRDKKGTHGEITAHGVRSTISRSQ